MQLGEILLHDNLISEDELKRSLAIARNTRTRLGDVLVSEGIIGYQALYQALASHYRLDFIDLLKNPPDVSLLQAKHVEEYLQWRAIPYIKKDNVTYIATSEYSEEMQLWARNVYGEQVAFIITSPRDIHKIVQHIFAKQLTHKSTMRLYEESPQYSALHKNLIQRRVAAFLFLIAIGFVIWWSPWQGLVLALATCHVLYTITMLFKLLVYVAGANASSKEAPVLKREDSELPVYTILIPMYKETESLPGMLKAMQAMDYPSSKLDIKLVFEADDHETIAAAYALKPHYNFEIISVPPSLPRTKPKACNYALRFARGAYITVYDADDRPDPQQLKKAIAMFESSPHDVVCLQARLNYYNICDNWLTRLFSLEYAMLFHILLPGLSRLHMPLMLGGTSNHISLSRLQALGEWDPFNVTEDADLGTRLAARGYKTMMLDSDTMEEAPNTLTAWIKQRSRWIKGYMQTWLVHMRSPLKLHRTLRSHGFFGFQCFVALSSFSYLSAPFAWAVSLIWLTSFREVFPNWLYWLAFSNLIANLVIHIGTGLHATSLYSKKRGQMAVAAILYPFYLILHSFASYVALWQLLVKPYVWNKTTHGKARTFTQFELTKHPKPI